MFSLRWTHEARAQYDALRDRAAASLTARQRNARHKSSRDEGLFKQVHKCLLWLAADPRHPGLQTHQYHALQHPFEKDGKVFEAYAQNLTPGAYRVFWCCGPQPKQITLISITPHP